MTFQKIIKVTCPFLFAAYLDKVDSHKVSLQSEEPSLSNKILQFATLEEIQISCTILMLDILLKQPLKTLVKQRSKGVGVRRAEFAKRIGGE
ncbi:hypothetical protein TKK_0017624 [Trichogramma kaykai]